MTADREAFEAEMRVRGWTAYDFEWDVDDYGCHDSRLAWAVWQAAIKHEREECAKVCESRNPMLSEPMSYLAERASMQKCAAAIRAR